MQHFKSLYNDETYQNTFSNIQTCLRLNDWNEIGDNTHYLVFHMIGLFSFQQWSLKKSVDFMWEFLSKLKITPDYVTIHPDKIDTWSYLYENYDIEIKADDECVWTDGDISGYCTEFYKDNIEIGNIVNTLGKSIDIGFGLERLIQITNSDLKFSKLNILEDTYYQLIKDNFIIGNKNQGHLLKKIVIESILLGSKINDDIYIKIRNNIIRSYKIYTSKKKLNKFSNKTSDFWLDTFGIDEKRIELYEQLSSY